MSSKINICEIIRGHLDTLKDDDRYSFGDIMTFFALPILVGIAPAFFDFSIDKDVSSLLVNFGSIFTALLLSVLVLVYDQQNKLKVNGISGPITTAKNNLLHQLYYNISYSILCALLLVAFCFISGFVKGGSFDFDINGFNISIKYDVHFVTPIVIMLTVTLFLNVIMIVKRMHALFVS